VEVPALKAEIDRGHKVLIALSYVVPSLFAIRSATGRSRTIFWIAAVLGTIYLCWQLFIDFQRSRSR
jgi:hypothetical protein